ncbi:MAG: putative Ice-binding-like adhesive domain [Verrucomicrobiota bacterium]
MGFPLPRFCRNQNFRSHFGLLIVAIFCLPASVFPQTSWPVAIAVRHGIDLQANGFYTDSFDSANPAKSNAGQYDRAKYSGDRGDILTDGGITSSFASTESVNIYGKVHTSPGAPISVGPSGTIGTHVWQASNNGFEPGYVLQDANFVFPDSTFPNTSGYLALPPGGTVVTSSYSYTTNAVSGSATYPNPLPPWGGVVTNSTMATVSTYPDPVPLGLVTNTVSVTSSNLPNPVVAGTVTNFSTSRVTSQSYPAPGSYVGGVTTNWDGVPTHLKTYLYNLITGKTYTYNTFTYTYSVYTYNYSILTTNTIYVTNAYDHILAADKSYFANSLSNKKVLINGPNVVLALPYGMDGTESLTWNVGATMAVYSGGTSITVSGNSYINPNGAPSSLVIYAAPTVTSFTLNGNGQFTGVLVAPNTDLTLNGGGSSNEDFSGSIMVNSVVMNGHFSIHLDESLGLFPQPVAATLSSLLIVGGNQFQFTVAGVPRFNYAVEASTNVLDWVRLTTNASPFIFVDSEAANFSQRYYRSVYLP